MEFVLIPFIVRTETSRNIIRPGTLAVRLTANLIAGHLLLTFLGSKGPTDKHSLLGILTVAQTPLLTLESVAVLGTLHSREVT
jgi:F-type H+-transporting ATPase subunit a